MWHLFKNNQQMFEFAFISKGNYIAGTRQGYENRSDALQSLNNLIRSHQAITIFEPVVFQDDTGKKSAIVDLYYKGKQVLTNRKPSKPYTV